MDDTLFIGGAGPAYDRPQVLHLSRANRHGLIAGATGTGKTVTLQILTEGFAQAGVPVFCADVKGDLSGLSQAGHASHKLHPKLTERARTIGLTDYDYAATPSLFWDVFAEGGHPVRATVSEMGPLLLARLLGLTEVQEGVLAIAFAYADDEGLLLIDLKDLQKLLAHMGDKAVRDDISRRYGAVATASLGAIQRRLLMLEQEGAEHFFGEPALRLEDLMRTTRDGRGYVSVLDARRLINAPRLYATFLLWLLSELFESLPEIGDPDRPRLVFFFDEAHLLFTDAPPALIGKVEQVVRLIRSKGVGVYFVTQNPRDVPDSVLAQLGNRIQHALRAYTPSERKAVRAAADSFRTNPDIDTEAAITELGVGEALVSTLDPKGVPSPVQRTLIRPPASRLGPVTDTERAQVIAESPLAGLYDHSLDRDSAYEALDRREAAAAEAQEKALSAQAGERSPPTRRRSTRQTAAEAAISTVVRTVARDLARHVLRGVLGSRRR